MRRLSLIAKLGGLDVPYALGSVAPCLLAGACNQPVRLLAGAHPLPR